MSENKMEPPAKAHYLQDLRETMNSYAQISDGSWELVKDIAGIQKVVKGEVLLSGQQKAKYIYYVSEGILRAFYTDENGSTFNKNLFFEKDFCASKVALLTGTPSFLGIDALENAIVITLPFDRFGTFIQRFNDLKDFYLAYLQQVWIIEREQRELSLVVQNATERYLDLLRKHPDIAQRISLYHIASHLGITPTQLSRIRKEVKSAGSQHM